MSATQFTVKMQRLVKLALVTGIDPKLIRCLLMEIAEQIK